MNTETVPMRIAPPIGAGRTRPSELLTTKLHVPRVLPGHVRRQRLIDQLDAAIDRSLVLVCAPAGFGKSALVAAWASRLERGIAWLSLDRGDDDPVRFWRLLAAAIERTQPGIADQLDDLSSAESEPLEAFVAGLVNELSARAAEIVLVLDDYDLIDDQRVHRSLVFLLEHRPPGLGVVVISRADPPLALPRLRARRQLTELRVADLRFTRAEAIDLLRAAVDLDFPDDAAATLTTRTEGWVAGLQLAALSLRERPGIEAFVAAFSGSHRYVLDYLTEEVLERQAPEIRQFLLQTSLLDRLSGDLCNAVTGEANGQGTLERIEQANLFLIPLDEVRGWWRYHQLFADLLRVRLQAETPERVAAIHRAAALWLDEHELGDEAIQHAVAAGDPSWAARLVERYADGRLLLSEGATLRRWLGLLPAEEIDSRPRLLLARANLALVSGDAEAFGQPLEAAGRALAAAPAVVDEAYEPSGGRQASLLANLPASIALGEAHLAELRGDADATRAHALHADELVEPGEWMLDILIRAHVSVSAFLAGRLDEAVTGFTSTLALCAEADERVVAARVAELLGLTHRACGRLDDALETYRSALAVLARPGEPPLPATGRMHVGIAQVWYLRNDLDGAARHLDEGIALTRRLASEISGSVQPLADALALRAAVRRAVGDRDGCRAAIVEAIQLAPGSEVTSLLNRVPADHARQLLAEGDVRKAVEWAGALGIDPDDPPIYAREPEHLALARILTADGRGRDALRLLDRWAAAAQDRPGSMIEIQVLRSLALAESNDEPAALDALSDAILRAMPQRWIRVFVDEGPPMARLLAQLANAKSADRARASRRPVPMEQLAFLLDSFETHPISTVTPAATANETDGELVEPLSERELEVLALLAAGRSNREIADRLFVTVDTVKKHNTHILGKLGAANRTEAAVRARDLGLLV